MSDDKPSATDPTIAAEVAAPQTAADAVKTDVEAPTVAVEAVAPPTAAEDMAETEVDGPPLAMADLEAAPEATPGAPAGVWSITEEHLAHAKEVCFTHAPRTPVTAAPSIHHRVWLKLESQQLTGSFKLRGAVAKLSALGHAERAHGVVTASAGNHGLGVAHAAKALKIRAKVFVPKTAPLVKIEGIGALGAEVVRTDETGYDATEAIARAAAEESGSVFISPFDDPWVAAGNGGTVGLEIFGMPNVATIVAPVGGGGLMTGLLAAKASTGSAARLVGVQSEACPSMVRSIEQGAALQTFEGEETLAEGLEGGVSPSTFHHVSQGVESMQLVTEEQIAGAMRWAHGSLGEVIEGSAAAALAWAIEHAKDEPGDGSVVVVITGRNVDPAVLERILAPGR